MPRRKIFIFSCVCLLLSNCTNARLYLDNMEFFKGGKPLIQSKILEKSLKSDIAEAVFAIPSVRQKIQDIRVASSKIELVSAEGNTQVFASGSVGVLDEYNTESRGLGFGSLRADRVLTDNNRISDSIKLAAIERDEKVNSVKIEINRKLREIVTADANNKKAKATLAILSKYLKQYEGKVELVRKAVAIGAISNSDLLEIEGIRSEALSKQAKAKLVNLQTDATLKAILGNRYSSSLKELEKIVISYDPQDLKLKDNLEYKNLLLQEKRLSTEISMKKQNLKPVSKLTSSITSPQAKDKGKTLFAGVTLEFPIRDGGKTKRELEILNQQKESIPIAKEALLKKVKIAKDNWASFGSFYMDERTLLTDRIKISKNRLKELEILQTQGRANSGIYIKEVLKLATTEIELEELETQQLLNSVDTLDASVSVCSLLRICGQIDKALEGY